MSRPIVALVVGLLVTGGCGGRAAPAPQPTDAGQDANVLLPDGTPPFDAATTYPGEGNACTFSIQCGERQICVDQTCSRHERFAAADLVQSELQRMPIADILATPIGTRADSPWTDFKSPSALQEYTALSWIFPGYDGPQLVLSATSTDACRVVIVGPHIRVLTVRGMVCHSATVGIDGRVAIGGEDQPSGEPRIVMFDAADVQTFDQLVPDSVHADLAATDAWGTGARAGHIHSMMFFEGELWFSVEKGSLPAAKNTIGYFSTTHWASSIPSDGLAVVRVGATGTFALHVSGGAKIFPGFKGWLVHRAGRPQILLARRYGTEGGQQRAVVRNLDDGSEHVTLERFGFMSAYQQTDAELWNWMRFRNYCGYEFYDATDQLIGSDYLASQRCQDVTASTDTETNFHFAPFAASGSDGFPVNLGTYGVYEVSSGPIGIRGCLSKNNICTFEPANGSSILPGSSDSSNGTMIQRYGKTTEIGWIDAAYAYLDVFVWAERPLHHR